MLIRRPPRYALSENDVTAQSSYLRRRDVLAAFVAAGGTLALPAAAQAKRFKQNDYAPLPAAKSSYRVDDPLTPWEAVTGYNNYYEFGTGKADPAKKAYKLTTRPWTITVEGEAEKTGTFALEDLIDYNGLEERIYRHRCVEAWSMVIPWTGVPLGKLLQGFAPTSRAKYVQFFTKDARKEMPGTFWPVLKWPYREGLRMDEALNPLSFLAVGVYGRVLPNQNGAPLRLVTPWKYGYKSIKSIDRIVFIEQQPQTSWNMSNAREYGFYSNVNPQVDHPRWSQASERVIGPQSGFAGALARRDTQMFNGYGDAVAKLYAGMDLSKNH
jgi:methionine sulfoxide reductase catalytic subunit